VKGDKTRDDGFLKLLLLACFVYSFTQIQALLLYSAHGEKEEGVKFELVLGASASNFRQNKSKNEELRLCAAQHFKVKVSF